HRTPITPSAIGQSTYSWTLDCKRSGGLVGNVVAYWNCTANGVSIQGNTAFCSATPGGGTVPSNANGIIVRVTASFRNCFDQPCNKVIYSWNGAVNKSKGVLQYFCLRAEGYRQRYVQTELKPTP